MLQVIMPDISLLDERHKKFVLSISRAKALSNAQYNYLKDCYDLVVSRKYGLSDNAGASADQIMERAKRNRLKNN